MTQQTAFGKTRPTHRDILQQTQRQRIPLFSRILKKPAHSKTHLDKFAGAAPDHHQIHVSLLKTKQTYCSSVLFAGTPVAFCLVLLILCSKNTQVPEHSNHEQLQTFLANHRTEGVRGSQQCLVYMLAGWHSSEGGLGNGARLSVHRESVVELKDQMF